MRAGTNFFQVGGTLAEDAPSYVRRPADDELFEALRRGELCLVLAPRQTGKSSLMVQARKRLTQEGVRTGIVDLQRLGKELDPDRFFNSVMDQARRTLVLKTDVDEWAAARRHLSPAERFATFLQDVVLTETAGDVVIFFDEIDSILKLPFSDDFFTTIRSLYNARATDPALRRLTFAFVGTTTKTAFIKDRSRTPFNIGTEIVLTDFDQKDTAPFKRVLGEDSDKLIDRIFDWTGGQPLLVQKLAAAAYSWPPAERTPERLDAEVERSFFTPKIEQDTHLKFIQDYLLGDPALLRKTLSTYAEVLDGQTVTEDDRSPAQERLKLAGVVRAERGRLLPRNLIYSKIFGPLWVKEHAPLSIDRTARIAIAVSVISLVIAVVSLWPFIRPRVVPQFPSSPATPYYVATLPTEVRLPAGDAKSAYLKEPGGEVAMNVEGGNAVVQFSTLPRGESGYTLKLEAGWFSKPREVTFKVVYYPGWQMRQFPDASLTAIGPVIQIKDGQIELKDASSGQTFSSLAQKGADTTVAVWSPSPGRLLAGGRDGGVRLWAANLYTAGDYVSLNLSSTPMGAANAGGGAVRSLAFASGSDNNRFISGHEDGTVRVWDYVEPGPGVSPTPGGPLVARTVTNKIFAGPVTAVASIRDGLVALSPRDAPKYYSLTERKVVRAFGTGAFCFAVSRDGARLATGGGAGEVKLWEIETGRELITLPGDTLVERVAFSADGRHIVAAAGSNLKIWEAPTGREVRSLATRVLVPSAVGFSSDGLAVFTRNESGQLQVWDFTIGREIQPFTGHTGTIADVAVSPDGRKLATASDDAKVKLWSLDTGELLHTLDLVERRGAIMNVWAVAFSPDGKVLASGSGDDTLRLWDAETGRPLDVIAMPQQVYHVAFSADGKLIAVGNLQSGLELIDSATRRVVRQFGQTQSGSGVAFSPDGRTLAAAGGGPEVNLWDVQTGGLLRTFSEGGGPRFSVAFSPDGKTLVSDADDKINVINVETGKVVRVLSGHEEGVYDIALSSDGSKLVSASADKTLRLWLVESGALLRTFSGHDSGVQGVAFSPDGKTIVSGGVDRTARLWWAAVER